MVSGPYVITKAPTAASKMVPEKLTFSPLIRRKIEAYFSGGHAWFGCIHDLAELSTAAAWSP
jgi:hypothetical protein